MTQQHNAIIAAMVSTSAILSMNAIFAFKYFPRWSSHHGIFIGVYLGAFLVFQIFGATIGNFFSTRKRMSLIIAAMALFWIVALRFVPVENLMLDRWQIVTGWLDNFFNGQYPYTPIPSAKNHVPGPFPVLFLLAIPFYWLNEIAYFSIAGFVLFSFLLVRIFKGAEGGVASSCVLNLFFALPLQYEVFARSTLFINAVLILSVMVYYDRGAWSSRRHYVAGGLVGGLLLSTRSIAVLPFIISFIRLLRDKRPGLRRLSVLAGTSAAVFVMTLLPLYLLYPGEFLLNNPISTENSLLPVWWIGAFFFFYACVASWFSRSFFAGIAWSGILLFLLVSVVFIITVVHFGFTSAFYRSTFDVSYFVLSLPFLIITQQQSMSLLWVQKNERRTRGFVS
jgi:hypothetical protein